MSTDANTPAAPEPEVPEPPAPIDTLRGMFQSPEVRNYLIAGFAALIMIFLMMFADGNDIGGLLLLTLGGAGIVFRWFAMPSFFLLILLWFLILPLGYLEPYPNPGELRNGHFRVPDVLLAFSVVIYLACHYRVYGLTAQALPWERRTARKRPKPVRRPVDIIRPGEISRLLYLTAGVVIAGQILWLLATSFEIDVNADFPIKLAEEAPRVRRSRNDNSFFLQRMFAAFLEARVLLLLGLAFFGTLLARIIFGYWRLRLMSAAEGGMMLQDAGWDETRRERTRLEKWRQWELDKAKAKAKTSGRPEPRETP